MNIWDKCSTIKMIIVEQLSQLFLRSGTQALRQREIAWRKLNLDAAHEHLGQMFYTHPS